MFLFQLIAQADFELNPVLHLLLLSGLDRNREEPSKLRGRLSLSKANLNWPYGHLAVLPYATISAIVPAPTVCPPSRIANRKPFSMATGVINSITKLTLSPGITISVPAGSSATPVTSVVRR